MTPTISAACPPEQHGTMVGYQSYRCRCPGCVSARRDYDRKRCGVSRYRIDSETGLPMRAFTQRRVLKALGRGGRRMTSLEIAERLEMSTDNTKRCLSKLKAAGHVQLHDGSLWSVVVPGGRVCAEPGCDAILSRYNPTRWCALHASEHVSHRTYMEVA